MKRFKKFLFLAMLVAMSFGFNNVVNAEEKVEKPIEVDIVKLKQDIVDQNSNKQIYFTKSDLYARTSFIEEEIHKMYANGLTEEEITKQAEELGLVELIVPEESANNVPTSDRANVSLGNQIFSMTP